MFFAIDAGHNCPPHDTGAIGIKAEDELTMAVALKVVDLINTKQSSDEAFLVVPDRNDSIGEALQSRIDFAMNTFGNNQTGAGFRRFVSIHFNKFDGNANGFEIFTVDKHYEEWEGEGEFDKKQFEDSLNLISKNIAALGFRNRGIKHFPYAVLRNNYYPSMLIECCFLDSPKDMGILDIDKMAIAIAEGLTTWEGPDRPPAEAHSHSIELTVTANTLLKPIPEQSDRVVAALQNGEITRQMKSIATGKYQVEYLSEEEGHYCIKYQGEEWFIYSGHCTIAAT